ncbi:type II toxin-antitoxin system Phd/YefM family antitoxin [Mucilaginibacter sp. L3T2-6]|uniref:type II toxin-antitoxin system Phd/YefM family antitoxin n=1 Tax=Mucilaginibacter sp. L3T2-6 TaxID=3062491 RepID=UPI002677656B|nr:type II toxin-antitoxin system prevent-host-death family antitoxin [Mucilaginibacter sp. L3T2-6]MDO3640393.1 type II toxin-antitoxin system prevent-host-death family antitoxin [Mucilaginibacter sp. L3T2-6]MDV6213268.1 type II toxin-antitoxin system prevent-host-death family antitoxin [Mucilaginibacter sp. L3T2-6]
MNFTEFRQNLAKNLDKVNNDAEIVIISRSKGKNVVLMDLEEYNAITETLHITKSEANRKRLQAEIDEMNSGAYHTHKLAED